MSSSSAMENLCTSEFYEATGLDDKKNLVGPCTLVKVLNYISEQIIDSDNHLIVLVEYIKNRFNDKAFDFKISGLYEAPGNASDELEITEVHRIKDYKFSSTIYSCSKKSQTFKSLDNHHFAVFRCSPKCFKYSKELTELIEINKNKSTFKGQKFWYSAWIKIPMKQEIEEVSSSIEWDF